MAQPKLLVVNGTFLTLEESDQAAFRGWMSVARDGTISDMGRGDPPAPADETPVLDAGGAFIAPGFVSAHSHLFTSASRGLGTDQTLYGWGEQATRYSRLGDSTDIYWLTLHGALDFLNNGITTAYDFTSGRLDMARDTPIPHFTGELRPSSYVEAQFKAKIDAGIRFVNSVSLDSSVGTEEEVLGRFSELIEFADGWKDHPGYLKTAISGAVQWSLGPETARVEVAAMRRWGVLNQPHFLETARELPAQRAKFAWYRDAGALGPGLVFGHFIHPTGEIMAEAARHGCGMSWQPSSNGRLASGVANIPRLRELGMRVGVGLDDQSCTDISDPFANMRAGIYLQRAAALDPDAMPVADMLRLHTIESAEVLGVEDRVGSLRPGKYADFVLVDPRCPDTGPVWDPVATYVLACGLRNLKRVYVGGELVSLDGRIVHADAGEVSRQVHERMAELAARLNAMT